MLHLKRKGPRFSVLYRTFRATRFTVELVQLDLVAGVVYVAVGARYGEAGDVRWARGNAPAGEPLMNVGKKTRKFNEFTLHKRSMHVMIGQCISTKLNKRVFVANTVMSVVSLCRQQARVLMRGK